MNCRKIGLPVLPDSALAARSDVIQPIVPISTGGGDDDDDAAAAAATDIEAGAGAISYGQSVVDPNVISPPTNASETAAAASSSPREAE